jgi:hypothetical protein
MSFLNEEAIIIDEIKNLLNKLGCDTSRLEKLIGLTTSKEDLSASELSKIENAIK